MTVSRREFLKRSLAGAVCLGAASLPGPVAALTNEATAMH